MFAHEQWKITFPESEGVENPAQRVHDVVKYYHDWMELWKKENDALERIYNMKGGQEDDDEDDDTIGPLQDGETNKNEL